MVRTVVRIMVRIPVRVDSGPQPAKEMDTLGPWEEPARPRAMARVRG